MLSLLGVSLACAPAGVIECTRFMVIIVYIILWHFPFVSVVFPYGFSLLEKYARLNGSAILGS